MGLDFVNEARPRLRRFLGSRAGLPYYQRAVRIDPQGNAIAPTGSDDAVSAWIGAAHVLGVTRRGRVEVIAALRLTVGLPAFGVEEDGFTLVGVQPGFTCGAENALRVVYVIATGTADAGGLGLLVLRSEQSEQVGLVVADCLAILVGQLGRRHGN
jgi:hypothetical protein